MRKSRFSEEQIIGILVLQLMLPGHELAAPVIRAGDGLMGSPPNGPAEDHGKAGWTLPLVKAE